MNKEFPWYEKIIYVFVLTMVILAVSGSAFILGAFIYANIVG